MFIPGHIAFSGKTGGAQEGRRTADTEWLKESSIPCDVILSVYFEERRN